MQDKTHNKQYALIDSNLQTCLYNGGGNDLKFVPSQKSMFCLTTFELTSPYPFLLTVMDNTIDLIDDDIPIFHEQYRRQFNMHYGIWLIITRQSVQFDFLQHNLPIGHGVYLLEMKASDTNEQITEKALDFLNKVQRFSVESLMGLDKASFFFSETVCPKCGSKHHIVTKIRLFKKNEGYYPTDIDLQYVDIPSAEFSYVLKRYVDMQVETMLEEGMYYCSMCNSQLEVIQELTNEQGKEVLLLLTAEDCLRYMTKN